MSAVMTGASSFETARSAPPQDEEENVAHVASGPHPEEGRKARLEGRGPSGATRGGGFTCLILGQSTGTL